MTGAIIIVSYLLGIVTMLLLVRHWLQHAAKCDRHKEAFWNLIEKAYPGLLEGQVDRNGIIVCNHCGKEVDEVPGTAR